MVELHGGKVHGDDGKLSVALCGNESKRGRENERELAGGCGVATLEPLLA